MTEEKREKNKLKMRRFRASNPDYVERSREYARERMRRLRDENPDQINEQKREWRKANLEHYLEKERESGLKKRISGARQEYYLKWKATRGDAYITEKRKASVVNADQITPQTDTCEICKREEKTVFDHCHERNIFRGWLCDRCNRTLGQVRDNPELLEAMASYIRKHRS